MLINKLKLWFNKNDFKILLIIICILIIYVMFKSFNVYYNNEKIENISLNADVIEEINIEEKFTQIDHSSQEYQKIISVIQKIINCIYQANISSDNRLLRHDIYNMFSDEYIQKLLNNGENISVDSILNFIIYVDNISDYAIGRAYKCNENNNVVKYAIILRYKRDEKNLVDSYVIFNMDYNNNTFSYEGMVKDLNNIDINSELNSIKNKGSNTF